MYIIERGTAYSIKGDKAYKVNFNQKGELLVSKEDFIDVVDQKKYTYDEMYKKLNVKYMIELEKKKLNRSQYESEELKDLRRELSDVSNENKTLLDIKRALEEKVKELEEQLNNKVDDTSEEEKVKDKPKENNKK